ncbi:MAG: peptidoglycan-associated lipoprotein [Paracoccaceae bacterium]|jgi:peptidoglycan-associated lipoprotein
MKLNLIGMLAAAVLALAGCASGVPDSGAGTGTNFKQDSSEFFNASVGDRVLFTVDQSTLTVEAQSILNAQAAWMMQNGEFSAIIEGHADEQGTREYNLALGARRAAAVQSYLVSKGVADSRLRTVTYGKERPLEICSNEACWSKNRRGVTVVSAGGSV